jgi:hypothetical protein
MTNKLKVPKKRSSKPYWDFHDVMEYLEKLHKKNFRDYAGKYSKEADIENKQALDAWLLANGYADKAHVLDKQNNGVDWPVRSKEMKLRIEINTKYRESNPKERPYQDFWHFLVDRCDIKNGCWIHLPEDWEDDSSIEDWQKEILKYFQDFLGDDFYKRMWVEW